MVKRVINFFNALVLILITSCSLNRDSGESLDYDKSKDLYMKKIGQYTFKLKPYSSEKLASLNYDMSSLSISSRDSVLKEYNSFLCFVFEIEIEGSTESITDYEEPGKENNYNKKVSYYLFDMQNDLQLKDEQGNSTPCTVYYHERMNEISKSNRFIVGFKRTNKSEVVFEYSNPYLSCGKVNISVNKQHLAFK